MTTDYNFNLGRSPEELVLMNPAFIATLLYFAVQGYKEEIGKGLPFSLAFLVPPVVLVKSFRSALPGRRDSSLAAWLQNHADFRLRFAEVISSLVPVVREGLLFAVNKGVLSLTEERIEEKSKLFKGSNSIITKNTEEFKEILNKARFVGRWYANSGSEQTIFALWGVRP